MDCLTRGTLIKFPGNGRPLPAASPGKSQKSKQSRQGSRAGSRRKHLEIESLRLTREAILLCSLHAAIMEKALVPKCPPLKNRFGFSLSTTTIRILQQRRYLHPGKVSKTGSFDIASFNSASAHLTFSVFPNTLSVSKYPSMIQTRKETLL